jgi:NAD(P)-dependent dehydrogenase (short-subunit alcohol dehydrogenase family)
MTTTNQQRNVFITGANRGLGLALAKLYLACGDRVFGSYRSTSHLEDLRSLEREWSTSFTSVKLDLAQPECFAETAILMQSLMIHLDVLINNAGIHSQSRDVQRHQRNLDLGSLETSGLQMMLQTNALGPLLLTQALLPLLEASPNATILNVSSRRGSLTNKLANNNYKYCE